MDLKGIGINTRNWVDSAQDSDYWRALANAALNLRVPLAIELVNSTEAYSVCSCMSSEQGRANVYNSILLKS